MGPTFIPVQLSAIRAWMPVEIRSGTDPDPSGWDRPRQQVRVCGHRHPRVCPADASATAKGVGSSLSFDAGPAFANLHCQDLEKRNPWAARLMKGEDDWRAPSLFGDGGAPRREAHFPPYPDPLGDR